MPRLKEVESLRKMAYQVLLSAVVEWFKELMTDPSDFMELRRDVFLIRTKLFSRIPRHLLADFSASLIDDCIPFVRDELDEEAIVQSILDVEIIGLRLTGPIIRFVKPFHAPRLRKLKELHMYPGKIKDDDFCEVPSLKHWKFRLNDLTLLKYPINCTDSELMIIGRTCWNLKVLDLTASRNVTDQGLCWLSHCPNLRVVKVDQFSKVTHVGLSFLVRSDYEILEEFSCGMDMECEEGFEWSCKILRDFVEWDDESFHLDSTVQYPSLTSFVYQQRPLDDFSVDIEAIVSKFPNLKRFKIKCLRDVDLSAVKYLDKVTELEVKSAGIRSRLSLGKALTVIGANLTSLVLRSNGRSDTTDFEFGDCYLNSVFDSCPNLKRLEFEIAEFSQRCYVIPPFQSLKELILLRPRWNLQLDIAEPILRFGVMLKLEILSLTELDVDSTVLKSIILDCVKFPNLKVVKTESLKSEDRKEIDQIVRYKNLDLRIESEFDDVEIM